MRIFFLCRTGHHTSLIAAAIYLYGSDRFELTRDITTLKWFDQIDRKNLGRPFFVGSDGCGRMVYTLGVGGENRLMAKMTHELAGLMGVEPGDFRIVDTSPFTSRWTSIGLFWKRLHLKLMARSFFYVGAKLERAALSRKLTRGPELLT